MNIVIDIRPLMEGKLSGVEIYILSTLNELFTLDKKNTYILFANATKDLSKILPEYKQNNVSIIQTKIPNKILNLGLSIARKPKLDKVIKKYLRRNPDKKPKNMINDQVDLFFMPDFRPSSLSKSVKKITVIHDLSFEHYKKFFSTKTRLWYKILNPKRETKNSDHIIAVSGYTKEDIIKTYKIPENKITVIHEGISETFGKNLTNERKKATSDLYNLPEHYFLFLSTIEPRKNIQNLVRGFIIFKRLNPQDKHKLVIAGAKNKKIFSKVMHDEHPDILFPGFIKEEDKAVVMKNAAVFLYPSFFEGFGLPLLEAMQCGTPIITSNTTSMPEVCGDAAMMINPLFPDAIAHALEKILEPEIRKKLKDNMEKQVKKFSWKKCARETLEVIQKFI